MPKAELISITPGYMELLKTACSQPYGKSVTDKSVKKIIESGHLSVLEHCYASFLVKCSVRVLGQLTRHRHLSFTVKSARGSQFDTFVNPITFEREPLDDVSAGIDYVNVIVFENATEEQAAYYLPQGVETSMVVTGNFRAWFEYLPKRVCRRAMPEHRKLAELIHQELAKAAPEIFDRTFLNCINCIESSCEFK